jgi:hypothetical protein
MNIVEQHAGCIWVSLFMAVGIHVLLRLLGRLRRSLGRDVPRDMGEYIMQLEDLGTTSVRADLYAAQARAALAQEIGKVPAEFDPTLLYACQVSAGIHRAATAEAERQGVIRAGTYERLFGRPIDGSSSDDGGGGGDRAPEPIALDEVRRRRERERREDRLARRGDARDAVDPFVEPPASRRERPAVPCSWSSDGRLVPTGRPGRRASA